MFDKRCRLLLALRSVSLERRGSRARGSSLRVAALSRSYSSSPIRFARSHAHTHTALEGTLSRLDLSTRVYSTGLRVNSRAVACVNCEPEPESRSDDCTWHLSALPPYSLPPFCLCLRSDFCLTFILAQITPHAFWNSFAFLLYIISMALIIFIAQRQLLIFPCYCKDL